MRPSMTSPVAAAVVMATTVALGWLAAAPAASQPVARAASTVVDQPCGWGAGSAGHYRHVIWLFLENKSSGDVIGPAGSPARRRAPYLNRLADRCGLASNYWAVGHPSLPNYLAAVSGSTGGAVTDCLPASCPQHRPTVLSRLAKAGRQWRVYAESMGTRCRRQDAGSYVARHNPAVYFPSLASDCARWAVPMGTPSVGHLHDALKAGRLPALSLIVPNDCDNSHDCSVTTSDDWMRRWVPAILRGRDFRAGHTALFITYDEGSGGTPGQDCTKDPDQTCRVATVVVSPSTRVGTVSATRFDHYSLLRTASLMLGVSALGHAADPSTASMRSAFRL